MRVQGVQVVGFNWCGSLPITRAVSLSTRSVKFTRPGPWSSSPPSILPSWHYFQSGMPSSNIGLYWWLPFSFDHLAHIYAYNRFNRQNSHLGGRGGNIDFPWFVFPFFQHSTNVNKEVHKLHQNMFCKISKCLDILKNAFSDVDVKSPSGAALNLTQFIKTSSV